MKSRQFVIGHFQTDGIGLNIFDCRDRQALLRRGMGDEFENDLQRGERFGAPVDRNERE